MTQISPPKNFGFFKRVVFIVSFISFSKLLDKTAKNLEVEGEKVKETDTLDKYLIQKTKYDVGLDMEVNKLQNAKNKLASQLNGVDISKSNFLQKMQEAFMVTSEAIRLIKETSKITTQYIVMFTQKDYLTCFNLFKNFLNKEGGVLENKPSPKKIVSTPIYREALDALTSSGVLLLYTNPSEFKKIAPDFEVFTKYFRNNNDLNKFSTSHACFSLLEFCSGNLDLAKLEIKKMYEAAIEEKAKKLKILSNKLDNQTIIKTLTDVMKKESGESEVPFFYKNFPSDFLKLVSDIGHNLIESKMNKLNDSNIQLEKKSHHTAGL